MGEDPWNRWWVVGKVIRVMAVVEVVVVETR